MLENTLNKDVLFATLKELIEKYILQSLPLVNLIHEVFFYNGVPVMPSLITANKDHELRSYTHSFMVNAFTPERFEAFLKAAGDGHPLVYLFQASEKTFYDTVVPAITFTTHATFNSRETSVAA